MLVRSVCTSQACNFQDEYQPGLQLVEKLATPLSDIIWPQVLKWVFSQLNYWRWCLIVADSLCGLPIIGQKMTNQRTCNYLSK